MSEDENSTIDVLDASYPLLSRFREKCPGTYSHGKNVASLLEALAVELGLNTNYLKMAGYYHDIGKMTNPSYFIENQFDGPNPHEHLDPYVSKMIIEAHVGNTAQILINDGNFPIDVIRWCSQHHGDSVMKFFFIKEKNAEEADYRYACSRPDSLEPGLLMLCDNLDARCKAMSQDGILTNVKQVVSETFDGLMSDTQLDNVELPKLSYIRIIKEVLTSELKSTYQSKRVSQPAQETKGEEDG